MRPVRRIHGRMVPLDRADVDTDQIMPKQFGKRIERTGYGDVVFYHWREEPDFVLNDPRYAGASVLVTGPNFGCGSSREHAPWGLQQYGFDAIVAPSFADIFASNCARIGLLTVTLPPQACDRLLALAAADPTATVSIDLAEQRLVAGDVDARFDIDPHTKRLLLEGLDEIDLALQREAAIAAYEQRRPPWQPTLTRTAPQGTA